MSLQENLDSLCADTCIYWAPIGNNGFGKTLFAEAVEIPCRWQDKNILFSDKTGVQLQAKAVVFTTADVKIEGYLKFGTLNDLDSTQYSAPRGVADAFVIKRFDKSPSILDNSIFLRKAFLTPYGGMS